MMKKIKNQAKQKEKNLFQNPLVITLEIYISFKDTGVGE